MYLEAVIKENSSEVEKKIFTALVPLDYNFMLILNQLGKNQIKIS
jgi:hypothetical protein